MKKKARCSICKGDENQMDESGFPYHLRGRIIYLGVGMHKRGERSSGLDKINLKGIIEIGRYRTIREIGVREYTGKVKTEGEEKDFRLGIIRKINFALN